MQAVEEQFVRRKKQKKIVKNNAAKD